MKARVCLHLSALVLLVSLAMTLGCAKAPNDTQIASDIQNKLSSDSGLQGKQLIVQVDKGVVTLSGTVDNDAQRDAASRYASAEAGVKQVVNNMQVAPPMQAQAAPPPPAPAPARSKPTSAPKKRHKAKSDDVADNTPPAPEPAPAPAPTPVAQAAPPQPPPPPPPPPKITIPSGTALSVRLVDAIDSEKNQTGDTFHGTLNSPLTINGDVE